ncbi:uncharacterized protein LOC111036975 [Myzus persicae]|uniref:uncharacterized protein LOC111036975 n=1 Tax=Myzus persicae TaxID=13164 RepID=UPI000B933044|nr:uncharacterized protein LOC111036975 [Myzus persicae]
MPVCNKCSVNITKACSIKCIDCDLTWHAKCQQLTKEDIDYLKEANNIWRCSKCASAKRASLRLENSTNLESNELLEIKEIILQLRDCFQNHKDDTAKNFEILNTKFNAIDKIITENQALKTHISQLEKQIESIERRQIANDIIIDARQIFRNFSSKFIDIQPDVPIYIRENLTTKGNKLFKEARDLKKQLNFQFAWTKNAIIFLRKNETDKIIRVDSEDTIQNIKGQYENLNS